MAGTIGPVEVAIIEPAGTVAHDMRGGRASCDVSIRLCAGARLDWRGEPFSAGVVRRGSAELDDGCILQLLETPLSERSGESGGRVRTCTSATLADRPAVRRARPRAWSRAGWATLRGRRVLDTFTSLSQRLGKNPWTLQLEEPVSVHRWMEDHLHPDVGGTDEAPQGDVSTAQ